MNKPDSRTGYDSQSVVLIEQVLVNLLNGLGPWKESVYLIGGLTPQYLVQDSSAELTDHAGTQDIDLVIQLEVLTATDAYETLTRNLQRLGFERAKNESGNLLSWRWRRSNETRTVVFVDLLADDPDSAIGVAKPLRVPGASISAINIPNASMVFDYYETTAVTGELFGDNGVATEIVRHADIVSFTCLKSFAFNHRHENKDAYDLIYCIERFEGGVEYVAEKFRLAIEGGIRSNEIFQALEILERRFIGSNQIEGYLRDGPVAVAKFELDSTDPNELREQRLIRQRQVCDLIERLLNLVNRTRS